MKSRLRRVTLLALYQTSLAAGILLMPVALLVRQVGGVSLPIHRVVDALRTAYEDAQSSS